MNMRAIKVKKGKLSIEYMLLMVLGIIVVVLMITMGQEWITELANEFMNSAGQTPSEGG
jgi:uncharacterized protein (UPF0333 family)